MSLRGLVSGFLRHARFFGSLTGWRFFILIGLTLFGTVAESVAIALLVPLFSGGELPETGIGDLIGSVLDLLGIPRSLEGVLLALVLFSVVKACISFVLIAWQHYIAARTTLDLRRKLIGGLEVASYRWFLGENASKLSVVITGETMGVSGGFLAFSRLFPHAITAAAFIGIVGWVEPFLAGAVVVFGILMVWISTIPRMLARKYAARLNEETFVAGSLMLQSLFSFKYLAATGTLARVHDKLRLAFRRITVVNYKLGATAAFATAYPQPLVALVLTALLLWLHRTRGEAALTTGLVVLVFLYRAMNEITSIQAQWQAFSATTPAIDAVRELGARLDANRERSGGVVPPPMIRELRLETVSFRYDDVDVLEGVDLTIPSRTMIAIVGTSGSGKTTLADLLTGLLQPSSGRILIDNIDLADVDLRVWRARLGYVPQDAPVFTGTIAENIAFHALDASAPEFDSRIIEAGTRALCHEFVVAMPGGWNEFAGERGNRLSGGQKQRVAIARELFKGPDILILDEATSALDAESENLFRQNLEAMRGTVTGIVIAHRLSTVKACDRVVVLERGRVFEQGTVPELLARDGSRFRELARLQSF